MIVKLSPKLVTGKSRLRKGLRLEKNELRKLNERLDRELPPPSAEVRNFVLR